MERGSYRAGLYDPGRERAHHLSIVIGHGLTACAVVDVGTGKAQLISFMNGTDLRAHTDLPTRPRSVSYVMLPEWSTLVPDGALKPDAQAGHLALVHGNLPQAVLHDEPVSTLGATCVYMHDEAHERKLLEQFPSARSLPLQAVLLKGAQQRSSNGPVMLIHRSGERVDLAIADGLRILLSNSYPARTPEDLLYFCLMATEKCGLTAESVALRSGGTHLTEADRKLLDRYFKDHRSAILELWNGADAASLTAASKCLAALDQFACVS
ncbi:MAG: DUF3822 family protein [Flavobacteriales bacterium]